MGCGSSNATEPQPNNSKEYAILLNNSIPKFMVAKNNEKILDTVSSQGVRQDGENIDAEFEGQFQKKKKKKWAIDNFFSFIKDNVNTINQGFTDKQVNFLRKALKQHHIFFSLSEDAIDSLVPKFKLCSQAANIIIFSQGDSAENFYIILKGQVDIIISEQKVRTLGPEEGFGDIALQFQCKRTTTVKTVSDSLFFQLGRADFQSTISDIAEREWKENLDFISQIAFFQKLTSAQMNNIAHHLINLKFTKGQMIVHQGDEANSYYLIKKGEVNILKDEKVINILSQGQSFGEQALYEKAVRGASVVAKSDAVYCLSLSRQDIIKVLGNNIQQVFFSNIMRWAFLKNPILKHYTELQSDICTYKSGEVVMPKGQVKTIIVVLEGVMKLGKQQFMKGMIYGEEFLIESKKNKEITQELIMEVDGVVSKLSIELIYEKTGNNYEKTVQQNQQSHELKIKNSQKDEMQENISLDELNLIKQIGHGSFASIYLLQKENSEELFALKVIEKKTIVERKVEVNVMQEKKVLSKLHFQFIMSFYRSFRDDTHIFLLEEYIRGQCFSDILQKTGILNSTQTAFYVAQLLFILEYLHQQDIVYRDLKPENMMVEESGYLKLIDMDTAKIMKRKEGLLLRTFSFVGTPHYMAPEIMLGKGYNLKCDLYSLGVCMFEFLCGSVPFGESYEDPYDIYEEIMNTDQIKFPLFLHDTKAKKLISQLLDKQPSVRMRDSFTELKSHRFFSSLNWDQLYDRKLDAPFRPQYDQMINKDEITKLAKKKLKVIKEIKPGGKVPQSQVAGWDQIF